MACALTPGAEKAIKGIIKNHGLVTHKMQVKNMNTQGGNYMAIILEVNIEGRTEDGSFKEFHFFVKNILSSVDNHKVARLSDMYANESLAYTDLATFFTNIQNEGNVPQKERYRMVPCYDIVQAETLILENMTMKGYTALNRMEIMPVDFATLAIQSLAKFHAMTFTLKIRRPDHYKKVYRSKQKPFNFYSDEWAQYEKRAIESSVDVLESQDAKDRLKKYTKNIKERLEVLRSDPDEQYALCFGDYRNNNILLKRQNDVITDLVPVDYQLLFHGCPLFDFLFFMVSSTDQEFRRQHMTALKNTYYDTFEQFISYFGLDAKEVYSRASWERDWREKLDYGLIFTVFFLPFFYIPEGDYPETTLESVQIAKNDEYVDRTRGLVDDYINWGFL